jgi:hypothetical protein
MRLSKSIALLALLATPLSPTARAMDFQAGDYEVGKAVICDTKVQAERFVDLFNDDATAAIGVVNAEQHDPTACGIVDVAYVRGPAVGIARHATRPLKLCACW